MPAQKFKEENEDQQNKFKKLRLKEIQEEDIGLDEEEESELFYEIEYLLKK